MLSALDEKENSEGKVAKGIYCPSAGPIISITCARGSKHAQNVTRNLPFDGCFL